MKTMICLILDRSGSMAGREREVIGGVNTFLDEQKALPDPASIAADVHDDSVQALAAVDLRLGLIRRKLVDAAPELLERRA